LSGNVTDWNKAKEKDLDFRLAAEGEILSREYGVDGFEGLKGWRIVDSVIQHRASVWEQQQSLQTRGGWLDALVRI
jgi:hypothetical protein